MAIVKAGLVLLLQPMHNVSKTFLIGLLILASISTRVYAQQTAVAFRVMNPKNEPIAFATVTLVSLPDSSIKQEKSSDSLGKVSFDLIEGKAFLVKLSSVSYQPVEKNILVKGDHPQFTFVMSAGTRALDQVVVTAAKPLMRQVDDKTIVDPEPLAAASTNAYEIMEKTPGLFVDPDGNIYLNSTTPATIYINGREQKMSATDIASMLKNLPPTAIASIEILRTPSARYDASGSGGIINVVLKKGVRLGFTGSATIGMNQGRYGNRFAGVNINNNNGALSTYLNVQVGQRETYDRIRTDRKFAFDSVLSQDAYTKYSTSNYYLGYGLSYQLNKKWDLSYDGRFSYNQADNKSTNSSWITKTSTNELISTSQVNVQNQGPGWNLNQGANLKYKIDPNSEWTTDVSFTYAPSSNTQSFLNGEGDLNNKLLFFSAQTNLVKKLPSKITMETGLKSSNVHFNNSTDYFKQAPSGTIVDAARTGAYQYREGIYSAYLQASRSFSGVVVKLGSRLENTNMDGLQTKPQDTSFSIHRTDLFPYVYISKTIMSVAGYDLRAYLVYRRTISRPAYEYLNPSVRFIDPYLYETGNPYLRPQFTNNYEANISVDERPLVAIGVNDTKDIFTQVIYPADSSNRVSSRTYDNLGSNKETYVRLLGAIPPGKRYFFVVGLQYNHNFYQGLYENKDLSYKKGSYLIFTYHTFKLTPLTQLSLNGYARFNGQQQFYELSNYGELRFSVNQQLLNKKLNLTLSMSDILGTNTNEFTINQGSTHASGVRSSDSRRFGINLRYNFGFKKKEDNNPFNVEPPEKS